MLFLGEVKVSQPNLTKSHDDRRSTSRLPLLHHYAGHDPLFYGGTLFFQVNAGAVLVACLGATAAFGLWRQRPWSRWVVYLISMLLIVYSAWYVWSAVQGGWSQSGSRSFLYFLPAALLLMFGVATPVHVARVFRRR